MREPRSIVFYARAALAVQSVLAAGAIAFVLAGTIHQNAASQRLHGQVEAMQMANLAMAGDFLNAEQAARGYQATGQPGLRRAYRASRNRFLADLRRVRRLATASVTGQVGSEAGTALAALAADDRAMAARPGSAAAGQLFARSSAEGGAFIAKAGRLRRRLARLGDAVAAQSQQILGVGLGWTAVVLAAGLILPVLAGALVLRRVSGPLQAITTMVRERAQGDREARAAPGGPADVRELARSMNYLADESDRVWRGEQDRARLQAGVRRASVRIREHLRADAIIREAVTAIHDHLAADFVWVGIATGVPLARPGGAHDAGQEAAGIAGYLPPGSVGWLRNIYRHRASYRVGDLTAAPAGEMPAQIRNDMLSRGATALLLTPFGAGQELLGCLALLRTGSGRAWTRPEVEAVEALAGDIGQGLEHARLYEGEERLVAELKSVDKAKSSFLASASHDLRTPLTSIIGYVELLADGDAGPVHPAQLRMLTGVDRNARRLKTMIEDMLTISKIELGGFTSRLGPVDLATLVPAAAEVISPAAAAGGLSFRVSCPDHGLLVEGDPEQLDRVLVNLLSNAVKYTPRGGSVQLTAATADHAAVVTVADTGIGIPEQDQASLFNRFFRAANAVETAQPGSGLGLSIVRTIVDNHHGELSVESAPGHGTAVTVRLPLRGRAGAAAR